MTESWLPIEGFEDYEVSNLGRVKSLARTVERIRHGKIVRAFHRERILIPSPIQSGHLQVNMGPRDGSKRRTLLVHRLVLTTFVGPCPEGMEACHNNGDEKDNRVENLRWDTRESNVRDCVAHGTHRSTRKTHCPKGHPYTEENTYVLSNSRNGRTLRSCRTCSIARCRAYRNRNKAIKQKGNAA